MTCKDCDHLRRQVDDLQAANSKHVHERQAMNRYGDRRQRQRTVMGWAVRVFGNIALAKKERALRLVEEALEVGQSAGLSHALVDRLADRVFSRDPGDLLQELGGVGVTLLAFAESLGQSAEELDRDEIERIFGIDPSVLRAKHSAKVDAGLAMSSGTVTP